MSDPGDGGHTLRTVDRCAARASSLAPQRRSARRLGASRHERWKGSRHNLTPAFIPGPATGIMEQACDMNRNM